MPSIPRPFFSAGIVDLEVAFERERDNAEFLLKLIDELSHRSSDRAARLKVRALQMLETVQKSPPLSPRVNDGANTRQPLVLSLPEPPILSETIKSEPPAIVQKPMPSISNVPSGILSAWTALEVLSPPAFRRPEDLAGGDKRRIAQLDAERLPWEGNGEKARPNTRVYYQIVLGMVNLEAAVAKLMTVYADKRMERPPARGDAVLAVIMINRDGRPIEESATVISSFGWAIPQALSGNLEALGAWQRAEKPLVDGLDKVIRRQDHNGDLRPLDAALINDAYKWLVSTLGLPADLVKPPVFAIRTYEYFKSPEPPEPLLLNSFFLADLATAADQFRQNIAPINLKRYLGVEQPENRRDLLHDNSALGDAIKPALFSPARWPGSGRHPLVLLQQAAVNLALSELRHSGILAVNGPPGTGKTTLLRDIVAALVTERARIMAAFNDPEDAFTHSGEKMRAGGNAWLHLYTLDDRLRGFEMLVASSNNKAVENVSAELPGLSAIAGDASDLRYFTTLSDTMRGRETWGLIAAVLGNAENRNRFKQVFWWNDDVGLSTYLAAATGVPRTVQVTDPVTRETITRPPLIVQREDPPRDHDDALKRWRHAKKSFQDALNRSEAMLRELEVVRVWADRLPALAETEAQARERFHAAVVNAEHAGELSRQAEQALAKSRLLQDAARTSWQQHQSMRPGFFARRFRTTKFRLWRESDSTKRVAMKEATETCDHTNTLAAAAKKRMEQTATAKTNAATELKTISEQLAQANQAVKDARDKLGGHFIDAAFFEQKHTDRQRLSPWLDDAAHHVRDNVFVAAIALHKAFIDAAAKPLRHNLGALMNAFSGQAPSGAKKEALLPHLWASLFLVVPVVSTTFASVERMLGKLPPETLGWLLIDEAGQALPQAAIGALMRTKRAVVVGDPLQIEPVVVLPDTLTDTICRRFGVDPDHFNAPAASVQTLADSATPYVAEFGARQGSRTVGVPLLVHRRCAEPMFGISNVIAYEQLMVNAKTPAQSAIRDLIGPSRWFDIQGAAEEKWCPQEGQQVTGLLQQLAQAGIDPNLYIISPFVIVQDNLRKVIRESGVLNSWVNDPWAWTTERVGTVHTVQGREAEAVIFVLGAPAPQQRGARDWAGKQPNLLNVAVTRAKEVLYVVGNRQLWREAGLFRELDAQMS